MAKDSYFSFFVINTKGKNAMKVSLLLFNKVDTCILTAIRLAFVVLATAARSARAVSLGISLTLSNNNSFYFRQRPLFLLGLRVPWHGVVLSAVITCAVAFIGWLVGAPQDQTRAMQAQSYTDARSTVVGVGSEDDRGEGVTTSLDREC